MYILNSSLPKNLSKREQNTQDQCISSLILTLNQSTLRCTSGDQNEHRCPVFACHAQQITIVDSNAKGTGNKIICTAEYSDNLNSAMVYFHLRKMGCHN